MAKKNAFYAQSGGVTAVINASACGLIETARKHKDKIGKVYAGRNGIIGALTEDLIDTSKESARDIAALKHTPSGAFGSCRYKLKGLEDNRAEYERLIEVFKAHNIGYFFYNGGGDSADTCLKVSQLSKTLGYPMQAIHVPKTVDNDLPITDNCPGFGSVAKYIAISTREASFDVASMCKTSTKVFVLEVMGRHAGWIAAAGGLVEDQGIPVVILFPEVEFDKEKFMAKVKAKVDRKRKPLRGKPEIGIEVGKEINAKKVAKHFRIAIDDDRFEYSRNQEKIDTEASLDGLYTIRSNVDATEMSDEQVVGHYKNLASVERAFRSLKSIDLRVRSHIFLCMLAYYIEHQLRELLAGNTPVILTVRDEAQGVILSMARCSELLEAIQCVKDRQVLHVLSDEPSVPYDDFVGELVVTV